MCDRPTLVSPGVLQVKFGRGGGNLQVYPGATGRSAAAAQPALKVAFEWAKGIRMVFNVGVDKSACLVSYDGSAPTADMKFPDGQVLPVVDEYRYLGALLTATGRVGRTIQDLEERILQKTGPLIGWARANQIPLSHLGKLWKLYVEPGIWWLVAALPITHAQADRLDLLQRKVARMLLGHGKRSPLPSALACLGWVPWSHLLACARMSLLARHVMTPAASWRNFFPSRCLRLALGQNRSVRTFVMHSGSRLRTVSLHPKLISRTFTAVVCKLASSNLWSNVQYIPI